MIVPRVIRIGHAESSTVVSCLPSIFKWPSVFRKLIGGLIRDHKHVVV